MNRNNRRRTTARAANMRVPQRRDRRKELQQLDVKMRSKKETQLRRIAGMKTGVRVAVMVLAIGATLYSGRWVYKKAFLENPDFELTNLSVSTNGTLTTQQILTVARVREGMNLLTIDLAAVRGRLGEVPQVEKVEVVRQLPDELVITLRERTPVAWLECPQLGTRSWSTTEGYMLDSAGYVLKCSALLPQYRALPVVRAHQVDRIKSGTRIGVNQVMEALDLMRESEELFFNDQLAIRMVELRQPYSMVATYDNDAEITFGPDDLDGQLTDLKLIFANATARNRQLATANLMARRNIPVRYFDFPSDQFHVPGETAPGPAAAPAEVIGGGDEALERLEALRAILGRG
ncbi:MAG: FtsQ-type POTRA domain-containing protein [Verrucomicrobiota bacterium]